jgi:predicted Ser/Thr protein kinase
MQHIELKGHSGCKIHLMNSDGNKPFVRKISKSIEYNERLKHQSEKQRKHQSLCSRQPEIYSEGFMDGLYYFDMEYIRGVSIASLLESCTVDQIKTISSFLIGIIKESMNTSTVEGNAKIAVELKLKAIALSLGHVKNRKNINKAIDILSNHDWLAIPHSVCHGDLTFENILISNDKKIYLIDFLKTFYDTWIRDVSKIMSDLLVGWSFRHHFLQKDAVTMNAKLRVLLLRKQFIHDMGELITEKNVWEDVYAYLLLDLLRIIPYVTDANVFHFLDKSLESITQNIKREDFYDHLNCAVRWPVYQV